MGRRNKVKIYSIILANHGKQLKSICSEKTEEKIYKRLKELLKESEKVIFPVRYNVIIHEMLESEYELVIIKCKQEGDSSVNKVRDKYGEYVDYESNDEDWIVIDRAEYNIEETFFVYGYHPRFQRKTFEWIFNNFILKDSKNKHMFKTVQIYKNKVLIDCNGHLELIICKNKSDSMRFYNLTEEWCKKKKVKYVAFMGDIGKSKFKSDWIRRIQELTGWPLLKIKRQSTRP